MEFYICKTCGNQYAESDTAPAECKICQDNRQYVGWDGQQWTTLETMWKNDYKNIIRQIEPNLYGIGTKPGFAIGHRALLVITGKGNVLWDPVSYLDSETIEAVHKLGGIHSISASHPHFYTSMIEWSHAFENAPIYLPHIDHNWIMRPNDTIDFYQDRAEILSEITVIRCGGHFPGSAVLYWSEGADGLGAMLTGDTIMVGMDRKTVSFMYSYPNLIPLSEKRIKKIVDQVRTLKFDRLYSAWWDREILKNANEIVLSSASRYIKAISV